MATYGKPQNKVDGTWMFSALFLQLFCEFENFLNETGQVPNVQSVLQHRFMSMRRSDTPILPSS